jgi:hypothetical protein
MGSRGKNRRKTGASILEAGKATRFKPGQSGNPDGRPRTAKFNEAAREISEEVDKKGKSGAERLALYCFKRALRGSTRHLQLFLAYALGRPRQIVEVTGPDGQPIAFKAMNLSRDEVHARILELIGKAAADPDVAAKLQEVANVKRK